MPAPSQEYTISNIVDNFIMSRRVSGVSSNTIRYYRDELKLLIRFAPDLEMDDLTPEIIRQFLEDLGKRRNQGGVHSVYRSVKALCNFWQVETDGEWDNPIAKVKVKPPRNHPLPGVPVADIQAMIDHCRTEMGQRDQTMLRMLLDTGARAFEFMALDIQDVDLVTGAVKIQRGKGDKERTVYIGKTCRRELRRYFRKRTKLNPSAPLWLTDEGERLTKRGLMSVVERRAIDAGVPVPGLHDFRRAFALNMWRNGVDILALSRLMGHSTIEVTKRYIADFEGDLREAHQKGSPVDNAGL